MPVTLTVAAKLKIERAKKHIQELRVAIDAFHASNPYSFTTDIDPDTGDNVVRIRIAKCIPGEISTIIGDVVHNLRSTLDLLVCNLVEANHRQVRRRTNFPISDSAKKFEPDAKGKMAGVSKRAERFIRCLKPYYRGNEPLWMLHSLDVLDKHRSIVAVGAAHVSTTIFAPFPKYKIGDAAKVAVGAEPVTFAFAMMQPFAVPPTTFPLEDTMEIVRVPADLKDKIQITTSVAFGKSQIAEGEPVVETLCQLTEYVERVADILARLSQ